MMTGDLEPAEREQRNEIAHMKRVGRWIEPGVDSDGTFGEALRQRVEVGAVRVKSTPLQIVKNCHESGAVNPTAEFWRKTIFVVAIETAAPPMRPAGFTRRLSACDLGLGS